MIARLFNLTLITIAGVALIALAIHLYLLRQLWQPAPRPEEWQAVMACEDIAGALMPRATVRRYRRWYYVKDSRFECRLYWWPSGEWTGSALSRRVVIEAGR